ncbi:response regulator transcription factor [candidate division KSB1 bacterium]|nr:response regulator transcription factor [candidate division KSB1 bacterium]
MNLEHDGFQVSEAFNGKQAIQKIRDVTPDLILLDVMMPDIDGFVVLETVREVSQVPVIMLTAKGEEDDRVRGLELGADDYVTKPFSPRELLARIKAILRRSQRHHHDLTHFRFGDIEVDFIKYEARKNGQAIHLTAFEFDLLRLFVSNQNKVLNRDFILDEIWGENVIVTQRTVDTHIANLRKKIEANAAQPKYIVGVRAIGYKFIP